MELYQIRHFLAFAECQNISKAAEQVHTSQPALSRSMKRLEEELGVPLFVRTKNSIALGEYGRLAVQYAKEIAKSADAFKSVLQETYKLKRGVNVASVAPAPLWEIEPLLRGLYPERSVASFLGSPSEIRAKLESGDAQLAILGESLSGKEWVCKKYGTERLFFSAPKGHRLEKKKALRFSDIDGETMLLMSDIGFWHDVHKKMMPNSRFLLQKSRDDFSTLVNASELPSFSTDVTQKRREWKSGRTDIPILDKEAFASYYAVCRRSDYEALQEFFETLPARPSRRTAKG